MTAEEFEKLTGRKPEKDDLDRVNCPHAGEPGHRLCGTYKDGYPRFDGPPSEHGE